MNMTVEKYVNLPPVEAAKLENITELLKNDRALYDLETLNKKKLSPAFIEKAMPVIAKQKDFAGSFKLYQEKRLNQLSNFKIFYDRVMEYSVKPKEESVNNKHQKSDIPRKTRLNM